MLPKLNYYSRYHRNKNITDIASLYNLINGLNLDVIVSEEMSFTLPSPIKGRTNSRRGFGFDKNQDDRSSQNRRHVSCAPHSPSQNLNSMKVQRFIEYNADIEKQPESGSEEQYSKQRTLTRQNMLNLQKVKNDVEIQSGANSRSLEAMDCLIQTESIHSVGNKSDQCPNSPRMVRVTKNPSTENQKLQRDSINNKKYSSIESLDIKKCSSHDSGDREIYDDDSSEHHAVQADSDHILQANLNPLGASSHNHREEDIYSEEFMDDIARLVRNNQDDRKSTRQVLSSLPQCDLEHSKSELLERLRGSDIEMDQVSHSRDHYFEYPSTIKKVGNNHQDEDLECEQFVQSNSFKDDQHEQGSQYEEQEQEDYEEYQEDEVDQHEHEHENQQFQGQIKKNNSGSPINNLQEVKEIMSEDEDHQQVQHSAVIQRLNFFNVGHSSREDIENVNIEERPLALTSPPVGRKSFKKVIRKQAQPAVEPNLEPQQQQSHLKPQGSPVNFKRTKKLNPRLVTSTILPEDKGFHSHLPAPTMQKVNFKKALMRGEENRPKPDSSKVSIKASSPSHSRKRVQNKEESKKLLQAFFQQN